MSVELRSHTDAVDVTIDGAQIAHYAIGSDVNRVDLSKPHFHPLYTQAGAELTGYAPEDHPWHHGLMFAFPRVNGHNLWGGGTFHDLERGYVVVDDHGTMEHLSWGDNRVADGVAHIVEKNIWRGKDGEHLLDEDREWTMRQATVGSVVGYRLDLSTRLSNPTDAAVTLSTPAGRGRRDGGYGGLFLRLAVGFSTEGLMSEVGPVSASGHESRTLVVHGRTAAGAEVTLGLSFLDDEGPGTQKWLYRFEDFASIGWAHAYDEDLEISANSSLQFDHRLVVFDGHIDAEAAQALL